METIKIFVGCDPNNCDLEQMMVLDYSIKKHTSQPVEIVWMQLSRDPNSFWYSNPQMGEGWNTTKWATPFSGFRWAIPEYCGFKGRAIYMDADMVVLDDIAKLWQHSLSIVAIVAAKGDGDLMRLCTCLWDCEKAKPYLPRVNELQADVDSHFKMMVQLKANPALVEQYQDSFNCVDGEGLAIEDIRILHYSDMGTQFSHKHAIPRIEQEGQKHWFDGKILAHTRSDLAELFDRYYHDAIEAGYQLETYRTQPFGDFPKKTHKRYKGNGITRQSKAKSWWQTIFKKT